jgi:hypothetical protein
MRKAEALVAKVAKSGIGRPLTVEQAFEQVLSEKANCALAQAALRPGFHEVRTVRARGYEKDDSISPASYEDDGGNTAQNARNAVIGRRSTDADKTGSPASARLQKFLTMRPNASDDEALGYALSRKSARKAMEARTRTRSTADR